MRNYFIQKQNLLQIVLDQNCFWYSLLNSFKSSKIKVGNEKIRFSGRTFVPTYFIHVFLRVVKFFTTFLFETQMKRWANCYSEGWLGSTNYKQEIKCCRVFFQLWKQLFSTVKYEDDRITILIRGNLKSNFCCGQQKEITKMW